MLVFASPDAAALPALHKGLLAMFGAPGPMEMLIIGLVVLLLFGNRLPSVMRSLGVGITEFKKGIKGEGLDDANASLEDHRRDDRRSEATHAVAHEEVTH
jgi:sec-independent protein translocase protein TatA